MILLVMKKMIKLLTNQRLNLKKRAPQRRNPKMGKLMKIPSKLSLAQNELTTWMLKASPGFHRHRKTM